MTDSKPTTVAGPEGPLQIAADFYYWKPSAAFVRCLELRAYRTAGVQLRPPVLDLGCHDTTFGTMLRQILPASDPFVGSDVDSAALHRARHRQSRDYAELVHGDAAKLPFDDGSFATIFANGTVASVGDHLREALSEIARVLRPGGEFICTVPTDQMRHNHWLCRLLRAVGLKRLAERGAARWDRRMTHANAFPASKWLECLEEAGLRVHRSVGFFPSQLVTRWSVLTGQPLRLMGAVRLIRFQPMQRMSRHVMRRLLGPVYSRTSLDYELDESAYILIRATKSTLSNGNAT